MTLRYAGLASATALLFLAALPAAAGAAPASASLCNGAGKVEVMAQALDVECGGGAEQERKALGKARALYQARGLDWQTRALIEARIDRRIRDLNRELRKSRS